MAKSRVQRVVVIGTGYVGLPLAIVLARNGYKVVGVDINRQVVTAINEGILHIHEDELNLIFSEKEVKENLVAAENPCEADVFVIAVPTPLDKRKEVCDLSDVIAATESIAPFLKEGNLVIVESTVPPLTCREKIAPLLERRTGLKIGEKIHLAHCPERILPGNVFHEIQYNDRIIGGCTNEASMMAREIYSSFVKGNIFITDDVTAEFCKLAENTYRDVNIALANELALVADAIGIDARTAIDLANKHPRVNILNPGIGVGGHCIPIDPWFLKEVDPKHTSLILAARRVNDHMPALVAARIRKELKDIENPRIVVLGITYKPDTNDLRESPALEIIRQLQEDGYDVRYHDPVVEGRGYDSISDVAEAADCLAVLVPHRRIIEELNADKEAICGRMRTPKILIF